MNNASTKKLQQLIWIDFLAGSSTALISILLHRYAVALTGFPYYLIVIIIAVHILYGSLALSIAVNRPIALARFRLLAYANVFWGVVSIGLLFCYFAEATWLGRLLLIIQVPIVGGLGWVELRVLNKK